MQWSKMKKGQRNGVMGCVAILKRKTFGKVGTTTLS